MRTRTLNDEAAVCSRRMFPIGAARRGFLPLAWLRHGARSNVSQNKIGHGMPKNRTEHAHGRPKRHLWALRVILMTSTLSTVYSLSYNLGDPGNPGPGLWPTLGSAVMLLSSIFLLVWERESDDYEEYTSGVRSIPVVLGLLIGFGVLLSYVGLTIPLFVFLLVWMRVLGRESWSLSLLVAALGAAVIFIAFDSFLGIPFPKDVLVERMGF